MKITKEKLQNFIEKDLGLYIDEQDNNFFAVMPHEGCSDVTFITLEDEGILVGLAVDSDPLIAAYIVNELGTLDKVILNEPFYMDENDIYYGDEAYEKYLGREHHHEEQEETKFIN